MEYTESFLQKAWVTKSSWARQAGEHLECQPLRGGGWEVGRAGLCSELGHPGIHNLVLKKQNIN